MTHDQLQSECWEKAWNHAVTQAPHMLRRFFAIPNSSMGFLGMIKAKQLESCGALGGVWDMVAFGDEATIHWIEFKVGRDTISDAQKKFKAAILKSGGKNYFYEVRDVNTFCSIFTAIVELDFEILNKLMYKC